MKIKIYIQPNSKKSGYAGLYDGLPKLKITAPPVENNCTFRKILAFYLSMISRNATHIYNIFITHIVHHSNSTGTSCTT